MERMTEDIEGLAGFMSGYFKDCLYVPILTVVYSVYLIFMNAPLAMICFISAGDYGAAKCKVAKADKTSSVLSM